MLEPESPKLDEPVEDQGGPRVEGDGDPMPRLPERAVAARLDALSIEHSDDSHS